MTKRASLMSHIEVIMAEVCVSDAAVVVVAAQVADPS